MGVLTASEILRFVRYDPDTGHLYWTGQRVRQPEGTRALACPASKGELVGNILGRQYKAARVVWAMHHGEWPQCFIHHLNGDNADNRLSNLTIVTPRSNPEERFKSYLGRQLESGCIEWQGGRTRHGYGKFRVDPGTTRTIGAHRYAYELANGPIPEGLFICHACDNPPCVNPAHLWLGTAKDNTQDMLRKGRHIQPKTHCNHGHELTDENRCSLHGRLTRRCRTCARERERAKRLTNSDNGNCGHNCHSLSVMA